MDQKSTATLGADIPSRSYGSADPSATLDSLFADTGTPSIESTLKLYFRTVRTANVAHSMHQDGEKSVSSLKIQCLPELVVWQTDMFLRLHLLLLLQDILLGTSMVKIRRDQVLEQTRLPARSIVVF